MNKYKCPKEINSLHDVNYIYADLHHLLVKNKYMPAKILEKIYLKTNNTNLGRHDIFDHIARHTNLTNELAIIMINDNKIDYITHSILTKEISKGYNHYE